MQQLHKLHNPNHPMLQYFSMHGNGIYKVKKKVYVYKKRTARTMNITTCRVEIVFPQMEDTFRSFV